MVDDNGQVVRISPYLTRTLFHAICTVKAARQLETRFDRCFMLNNTLVCVLLVVAFEFQVRTWAPPPRVLYFS